VTSGALGNQRLPGEQVGARDRALGVTAAAAHSWLWRVLRPLQPKAVIKEAPSTIITWFVVHDVVGVVAGALVAVAC